MARVSLILPVALGGMASQERIIPFRHALEDAGHEVEVIVVADPRAPSASANLDESAITLVSDRGGMAVATLLGLREATGDLLVVLDLGRGYTPLALLRVVEPVVRGEAGLAVASRHGGRGFWGGPRPGRYPQGLGFYDPRPG